MILQLLRIESRDKTGHVLFVVNEAGEYVAHAQLDGYRAGHGHGVVTLDQKHEVVCELVKEPTQPPAKIGHTGHGLDRQPTVGWRQASGSVARATNLRSRPWCHR